jgi:cation:H+ antiporter
MFLTIFLLIISFVVIWLSTEFAIASIEKLSSQSKWSKFTLSLFVIGIVTSLPEIGISINSIVLRSPQVALGNLIGSQVFLLFLVIPVLTLISKGLHLRVQMRNVSLSLTLLVALVPMLALLNQSIDTSEVMIILAAYLVFVITFARQENLLERIEQRILHPEKVQKFWEVTKLLASVGILLFACNTAVREIIDIASVLQTPRFLLSMLILPIGTNLPELSLAIGSFFTGKRDFALGDFMGALTFNAVLIALLVLWSGGGILIGQDINLVIGLFAAGVILFWLCCYSKELLSVKEGAGLLFFYLLLVSAGSWVILTGVPR